MKENVIKEKSFAFAIGVIQVYQQLRDQRKEYELSRQILKSGTAIGAMVREAEQAESKADFIHKLAISLKEANETEYWLDLLVRSTFIDQESYGRLITQVKEIIKILTAIIKSAKQIKPKQIDKTPTE